MTLSRPRKIAAAVFMMVAGTAAGLLLLEMFLRFYPPEWLKLRMQSLNLRRNAEEFGTDMGWSVERTDGRFLQFTPNTQFHVSNVEYETDVHIDPLGGRVVSGNAEKNGPLVPCFGDSFMFGVGVDDSETFVSLLSARGPYRFLNLGVPGSALPQHLDILELRHARLHSPRVYVFSFFTGNDFVDIVKYYTENAENHGGLERSGRTWLLGAIHSAIVRFHFLGRSYLVVYCKQILINRELSHANQRRERTWAIHLPTGGHLSKESIVLMDKRQLFRRQAESYLEKPLARLVQLSRENHFTPFVIVIPDKYQVDPDLLAARLKGSGMEPSEFNPRLPDLIVTEELNKFGIRYFDLFDVLNGKKGQYYKFDDHFTPAGCKTAAVGLAGPLGAFLKSAVSR